MQLNLHPYYTLMQILRYPYFSSTVMVVLIIGWRILYVSSVGILDLFVFDTWSRLVVCWKDGTIAPLEEPCKTNYVYSQSGATKCNSLVALRDAAKRLPNFRSSSLDNMAHVKSLLAMLVIRLELKGKKFCSFVPCSDGLDVEWASSSGFCSKQRKSINSQSIPCLSQRKSINSKHGLAALLKALLYMPPLFIPSVVQRLWHLPQGEVRKAVVWKSWADRMSNSESEEMDYSRTVIYSNS